MPQFAGQSIQAAEQVNNPTPVGLDVAASPVNTYVDPGVNNLQRLGESLGFFNRSLQPYAARKNHEAKVAHDEGQQAQAMQDFTRDNANNLSGENAVPESADPIYKETYMHLVGINGANQVRQEAQQLIEDNKLNPDFNPAMAMKQLVAKNMGLYRNKDSIKGFYQGTADLEQHAVNTFVTAQKEAQRQDNLHNFNSQIANVFASGGSIAEKHNTLNALAEQFKNLGIPRADSDKLILHASYDKVANGDLGYMELMHTPDPQTGKLLVDQTEQGRSLMEHAYKTGVAYNENQAAKAREDGKVADYLSWDETLKGVTPDTDAVATVLSRMGGKGSFIGSQEDVESRVNQIRTMQAKMMKQTDFNKVALMNPNLAYTMSKGDFSEEANEWLKGESDRIFGPAEQDPKKLQESVNRAHAWMDTYPGFQLPGYEALMKSGMSSLQSFQKDASGREQTPEGFKMVYQEYLRDKVGANKRLGQSLSEQDMDLLRVYDDAQAFGSKDETQAFQAVLNYKNRDPNLKRSITESAVSKLKSSIDDEATSMWHMDGKNLPQLQDAAMAKYRYILQTSNASEEDAVRLATKYVSDNVADVAGGKTLYAANAYKGLDKNQYGDTLTNIIGKLKERPDIKAGGYTNLQAYSDTRGNITIQDGDGMYVVEKYTPDQIKAAYSSSIKEIGMRQGDLELQQKLRRVLADPNSAEAKQLSTIDMERLKPFYDLYRTDSSRGTAGTDPIWNTLGNTAKANDQARVSGVGDLIRKSQELTYSNTAVPKVSDYPTDVLNPGGHNLKTLDYARQYNAKGDIGSSLTMMAEGIRLSTYTDDAGKRTIGIGYNIDAHGEEKATEDLKNAGISPERVKKVIAGKEEITPEQAVTLFNNTMKNEYIPRAKQGFGAGYDHLPDNVKAVLNDLAYNAGSVTQFQDSLDHIRAGNFDKVADSLNLTYTNVDGVRVKNNRRINMYQQMLAGRHIWNNYLDTTAKQTSRI